MVEVQTSSALVTQLSNWLSNLVEQIPSCEASRLLRQEILPFLWNPKFYYRVNKSSMVVRSCAKWIQSTPSPAISLKSVYKEKK